MRIRRIELQGFKSFVERCTVRLSPGICGVVGPNGCGKSNIIDAIKWTLGEQSPGVLRGKAMEDVIFAGSEARPPANFAEVTIAFDNEDGAFGGQYARFAEIEVGRRLYRNGDSSYLINRTACRLKDVVALFLDTGVGARAYSIIEQGRVGFVVNAKADERRVLIDEVAGINRFKAQRAEAERRMKRTRENLVRVADLLQEMGRQRRSLQGQARKATQYLELRREWKSASLRALVGAGLQQATQAQQRRSTLVELATGEKKLAEALATAQSETEDLRLAAESSRAAFEGLRQRKAELESEAALKQRELQFRTEEKGNLGRRLGELKDEIAEAERLLGGLDDDAQRVQHALTAARQELLGSEGRIDEAGQHEERLREAARAAHQVVEEAKAELLQLMTDAARSQNLASLLERQLAELDERLAGQQERLAVERARLQMFEGAIVTAEAALASAGARRSELASKREVAEEAVEAALAELELARVERDALDADLRGKVAGLHSLRELLGRHEGLGEALRRVMAEWASDPASGVLGTVADLLRAPEELEPAVEAALGERLSAVVVRDVAAAQALLIWMDSVGEVGRLVVVPHDLLVGRQSVAEALSERVEAGAAAPALSEGLLGRVRLVDRPASALDAAARYASDERTDDEADAGCTWVTSDGSVADRSGLRVGQLGDPATGVLRRHREARELEAAVAHATKALEASHERFSAQQSAVAAQRAQLDAVGRDQHEAELAELGCKRDRDEAERGLKQARGAVQQADEQRARWQADRESRFKELGAARARTHEVAHAQEKCEEGLGTLREAASSAESAAHRASGEATSLRVELATLQQAAAGHLRDHKRIDSQREDLDRRLRRAGSEREGSSARAEHLEAETLRLAGEIERLAAEAESLAGELAKAENARDEAAGAWKEAEGSIRHKQDALDAARRGVAGAEVTLAETRSGLRALRERAARDFDLDLRPLLEHIQKGARPTVELGGQGAAEDDEDQVGEPRFELVLVRSELEEVGVVPRLELEAVELQGRIDALGPVNLAATAEFREIDGRWSELDDQKTDLEQALTDLRKAIGRIEQETRDRFKEAFRAVSEHFAALYPRLVGGGRAELRLTDADDMLTTGIDIVVEPPGKRLQNLTLLSGGEKAMAAIALVFAIFQVKPSPFCLLDEVDAPLDESNSRRFNAMLAEMAAETQFVVITHNRTTMEAADVLYGVTMQQPGASTLVSVSLDRVPAA